MLRTLFAIILLALAATHLHAQQANFKEGVHYKRLANEQTVASGKAEVVEFFSYGCPHCADFDPYMESWKKRQADGVTVKLVPVTFGRAIWGTYAKAYYAADSLNVANKVHKAIFTAVHKSNKPPKTADDMADIAAAQGVDRQLFLDTMNNSFEVDMRYRQGDQMAKDYRVSSVPLVAVNGKYLSSGQMAGNYPNLLKVIDYLLAVEKKP